MERLSNQQIIDADLTDWRKLAQAIHARFGIPDFAAGAAFVSAVADAAEEADHHPDLTLSYGRVDVALATHSEGNWITTKDVDLARRISAIAQEHRLTPDPTAVAQLEMGLDTSAWQRIGPFWAALLTGDAGNVTEGEVLDPSGRIPNVWFQPTEDHEAPRQRWHPDLWLAPEVVQERLAAAVAAGGRLVSDDQAPSFWVLADPDDNKVCICTHLDRAGNG